MTVPYTFGNESSPIPLSQLDANFAAIPNYANTAGYATNAVQANITSVGTLTALSVAGNIIGGNLSTAGLVLATGSITGGNILTTGEVSAYGTVTGGNITTGGNISADIINATTLIYTANNVSGGNIYSAGIISAGGNILAQGIMSATGNIETAQYFIGNFQGNITGNLSVGGSNTQVLFNNNGNVGAAGGLTYTTGSNTLGILGVVSAQGNIIGGNLKINGTTQLVGVATAPTAPNGTANNQVATTAFVSTTVGTLGTMATQNAVSVAITGGTIGNGILTLATIDSATITGVVTAPTPAIGTSNTQVATTAFVNNNIPSGVILMWSGSIASIPSGWYLCNGSNGTPNLEDRFIVGAGSTYAVGTNGGSADAVVVSHTHAATVTDPGHAHGFYAGVDAFTSPTGSPPCAATPRNSTTATATTGITVSNGSTGVSGTNANLPPYYALSYIMKA